MTEGLRPRVTGSPVASCRCSCPWNPNPSGLRGGLVWRKPRGAFLSLRSQLAFPGKEPGRDLGDDHPVGRASVPFLESGVTETWGRDEK